jgi:hypothetical protein
VECLGCERLALQHLYRTVGGFLAPARADLERALCAPDRDLFTQELDLLFIDTTSTFAWRPTERPLRQRGYSRDRHPDQCTTAPGAAVSTGSPAPESARAFAGPWSLPGSRVQRRCRFGPTSARPLALTSRLHDADIRAAGALEFVMHK